MRDKRGAVTHLAPTTTPFYPVRLTEPLASKICSRCKKDVPIDDFRVEISGVGQRRARCRECELFVERRRRQKAKAKE